MGGLSIWHLIVVLLLLAAAAGLVGLLVWLFGRSSRRAGIASGVTGSEPLDAATVESRLLQLDDLWGKGVITESEYEQQRSEIIKGI